MLTLTRTKNFQANISIDNNFGMKHGFAKYLKKICRWSSDEHFSFKYFLNIAFVREISQKLSGGFGCYRHEWFNLVINDTPTSFHPLPLDAQMIYRTNI